MADHPSVPKDTELLDLEGNPVPRKAPDEVPGFFDKKKNVRLLIVLSFFVVLALFACDFFLHYHIHMGGEQVPGFYLLFGLVASIILIVASKLLAKPLKRKPDYWDDEPFAQDPVPRDVKGGSHE